MRTLALTILACIGATSVPAQTSRFTVGGFGGANITTWNSGFGWNAGMVGLFDLGPNWVVQTQIGGLVDRNVDRYDLFSTDGSNSAEFASTMRRSWIESSTLMGYRFKAGDNVGIFAGTGFTTRFLIQSTLHAEVRRQFAGTNSGDIDNTNLLYRWSFLVPLQLSTDITLGHHTWGLFVEYYIPLRNLNKPTEASSDSFEYGWVPGDIRVQSLSVKLAYLLPIEK